ncbi:MAG: glycosyltransferase [Gammaproteobacteria bacterium]
MNEPDISRKRLAEKPKLLSVLVRIGLSIAQIIRKNCGVLPALRNMFYVLKLEGFSGIRVRLLNGEKKWNEGAAFREPPNPNRILVMDYRIPMAEVSAGERATVGILSDLCKLGYEVVFLPKDMVSRPQYEVILQRLGVTVITGSSGFHSPNDYLNKHGHTFSSYYLIRIDVAETVLSLIRAKAPSARIIFHAPDLYFLREMREAELHDNDEMRQRAEETKKRELAMMRGVDHVVIVSPAELPVLQEYLIETPISVFPALYVPVVKYPAPPDQRRHVFFLGGFAHTPNIDAVQWFVADIWPLVRQKLPDAEFHIIGAEAPQIIRDLKKVPGVRFLGFVEDIETFLSFYRVGVAPLRYGAGIKGKVAMTLGAGVPCVCTSIAAEGMDIENGEQSIIADTPIAFADAVIRLLTILDDWNRLSINGRELVERKYGEDANRAAFVKVLNDAGALPFTLFSAYCQSLPPRAVPVIPENTTADVSVIVPVYNKWALTRACLNSILETCQCLKITYELILADDSSTDETVHAAETFPGLRVVKTKKNVGFLRNCNNAAGHARGRYILLLNNDTLVLPGWLTALFDTIENDPSIAIVGSKLLYPDGHIQEAGGGLLANGDGVSIGRWKVVGDWHLPVLRQEPVFNVERETDYISGASLLVRKSFWDDIGGFDERYHNAYCEDSDLALTARSRGFRVVYQPASEVVHFEHQSYAEQESADHALLQQRNKQVLLEKWGEFLRLNHLTSAPWHLIAAHGERVAPYATIERRKTGKFNILYFSPFPSHPSSHGNQATIQQFARRFQSLGHKVHFVLLQSGMYTKEDEMEMRNAWDTLDILPNSRPLWANGSPIPFDGWYEEGLGERIRILCAKYDIDIVFCSYVFQSKLLEFVPDYMLKVIDTHDKMGDRYEMLRKNGQPLEFFSCTPEEEGAYLRRADIVVARRSEEARYFDSVTGRNTAIVVPHMEAPHFLERKFDALCNVGTVASANRINLAIVRECLETIDRKLAGQSCPFTVHIAGQVKDMVLALPANESEVFRLPWVHMHGFVPDIEKFYAEMDLIISPVTMGTGINVKTVQAMAYGMPLLTTAWGAKGIETGDERHTHQDMDSLSRSLFDLVGKPEELNRLACLSRSRYLSFFEESQQGMASLFFHPKLTVLSNLSPVMITKKHDRVSKEITEEAEAVRPMFDSAK